MSNLRQTIQNLSSQFAANILEALRTASLDELAGVAGTGGGASAGAGRWTRPAGRAEASAAEPAAAPRRRGRGGRLGRRSAGDISQMVDSIVNLLSQSSEGMRAEQIREALGVEAKELPRPLAEALESGRVSKSGQKRATTYFAGSGGAGGGSAAKRAGRVVRRMKKR